MRGYFLTNMYLSSIQCGIQSAHCIHDMFIAYRQVPTDPANQLLLTWATDHKTMIVLNGGTTENLEEFYEYLMKFNDLYPFDCFNEPGIGDAMTVVGIVLPETMIELMALGDDDFSVQVTIHQHGDQVGDRFQPWQLHIADTIRGLRLAS